MLRLGWAVIVLGLMSCSSKSGKVDASGEAIDFSPGGFIEIDMGDEEDEDLFSMELMTATADCGDLVKLEPKALMGVLQDGQIRCLDKSIRQAELQTVKDKLSRVLMADAWAKADHHRWEGIVRKHLEEITRSDPDLCYKFALYLSKKGPAHADETQKWADVALSNKTMWTGAVFSTRVYSLLRLKTLASFRKWQSLEKKLAQAPDPALKEEMGDTRNYTKTLAREWLEYANLAGKDITVAFQICTSAAGTSEFCELSE